MEGIVNSIAAAIGGKAKFSHTKHYPVVYNNEIVTEKMREAACGVLGEDKIKSRMRSMGGEDFSYFAMEKPGCMMRLGIKNDEKGIVNVVHKANLDIDEECLDVGVKVYTQFILDNMDGINFD